MKNGRLPVPPNELDLVFPNQVGKPMKDRNLVTYDFRPALRAAKLPIIRWHDLRHTYATLRVAKGDNIKDISRQLGHASISITLDIYSKSLPGEQKSEVDELDLDSAPGRTPDAPQSKNSKKKH